MPSGWSRDERSGSKMNTETSNERWAYLMMERE
jgi:hypothetical protein